MFGSTNPEMIVLARESRGISQAELADRIGMSPANLSKIERKDISVSDDIVDIIADQTDYPSHFFKQSGEAVAEALSYRRRETVAQKILTPIHAKINILRRHVTFLTDLLKHDVPRLPVISVEDHVSAGKAAANLRRLWNLERGPVANLIDVIENQGILTLNFSFETDRVDSRSAVLENGIPVIFFNSDLLGDRQRFSLAYELGRLILHTSGGISDERNIAKEASAFAAEFLMPAIDVKEDFKQGISIASLRELKKKWKVSMIALLYRADDLGFVTPNQKRYLIQQFNQLKIRKREPAEVDVKVEISRLFKSLIADFRTKTKLGIAETSALFFLNTHEFLELYS